MGSPIVLPGQLNALGQRIGEAWEDIRPRFDPSQRPAFTFGRPQPPMPMSPPAVPVVRPPAPVRPASSEPSGMEPARPLNRRIDVPDSLRAGEFQSTLDPWASQGEDLPSTAGGYSSARTDLTKGQIEQDALARNALEGRHQQRLAVIDERAERDDPMVKQLEARAKERQYESLGPAIDTSNLYESEEEIDGERRTIPGAFRKTGPQSYENVPRPGGLTAGEASKFAAQERLKRAEQQAKAQGELDVNLGMIGEFEDRTAPLDRKLEAALARLDQEQKAGQITREEYEKAKATAEADHRERYDKLLTEFLAGTGRYRRNEAVQDGGLGTIVNR